MKIEYFQSGDLCYVSLRFALKSPGFGKEHGYEDGKRKETVGGKDK